MPLAANAVDVSFHAPDKTWGAGLTRPTLNVFLWDVASAAGYSKTGLQQRVNPTGNVERRPTNPVVDLGYLVTAWATEYRDEHELLGSVLQCVLANKALPEEFLPDRFAGLRCGLSLAPGERRVPGEFWSALDGRLKPGLQLQVALPVEVFAWQSAAAPAEQVQLTVDPRIPPAKGSRSEPQAGGRPGETPAAVTPEDGTDAPDNGPTAPDLTRRRRNGAIVMEARSSRKPPTAQPGR